MEIETLAPVGIATHSEGLIFANEAEIKKVKYPFVCEEGEHSLVRETGHGGHRLDVWDILELIKADTEKHQMKVLKNEDSDVCICTVVDWQREVLPMRNKLAEMAANRLKIISFGDKILGPALFCKVSDLDGIEL